LAAAPRKRLRKSIALSDDESSDHERAVDADGGAEVSAEADVTSAAPTHPGHIDLSEDAMQLDQSTAADVEVPSSKDLSSL